MYAVLYPAFVALGVQVTVGAVVATPVVAHAESVSNELPTSGLSIPVIATDEIGVGSLMVIAPVISLLA